MHKLTLSSTDINNISRSVGATIRMYIEAVAPPSESPQDTKASDALKPLVELGLRISRMQHFTGRDEPTVITSGKQFMMYPAVGSIDHDDPIADHLDHTVLWSAPTTNRRYPVAASTLIELID
eukprot:1384601-Amorphochlora_amoeboformis.AAC.1